MGVLAGGRMTEPPPRVDTRPLPAEATLREWALHNLRRADRSAAFADWCRQQAQGNGEQVAYFGRRATEEHIERDRWLAVLALLAP